MGPGLALAPAIPRRERVAVGGSAGRRDDHRRRTSRSPPSDVAAPAGKPFTIRFHNNDAGVPHNVDIHRASATGPSVFKGEIFPGVDFRIYEVPTLAAGTYIFVCDVHPTMTGTLTAQ